MTVMNLKEKIKSKFRLRFINQRFQQVIVCSRPSDIMLTLNKLFRPIHIDQSSVSWVAITVHNTTNHHSMFSHAF